MYITLFSQVDSVFGCSGRASILLSSWVLIANLKFLYVISVLVTSIRVLDKHRNVGSCNFVILIFLICKIKKDERKKKKEGVLVGCLLLLSSTFVLVFWRLLSKFGRGLNQLLLGIFRSLEFLPAWRGEDGVSSLFSTLGSSFQSGSLWDDILVWSTIHIPISG